MIGYILRDEKTTPDQDQIPEEEWPTAQPVNELPFGDGRVFHEHEDGLNDEEILPLWWDWIKGPVSD